MIFFNGLKRLLISLLTLHLLLSSLSAVNIHKQFTANSEEYKDVVNLCILTGTALPSSMTPVSAKELLLALDRIDYNNLSKALKELYDSAYKKIAGPQSNINLDPLFISTNPSLGIEAYAQTQSDTWLSSNDWTNQYRDRLKLVELPIEIGISNYFYGRVIPELSLQFTQPMGENREGFTEFNKIFTTNIDIRKGTQRSMPLVSEAVIGTDFLHLYIGRNRQALGLGYTGNLMIGDNFIYQDFGKFTIHTNYFTYNLSITVFDRQKNTLIDEYTPLGATKLSSTSFNGKKQYRVVNNYQINLFDKASIYLNFGNLFDSDFDFRMINPFYIMHNIFNFTSFGGNDYGDGAAIEANNHFSLALSYPFYPGWSLYLETMIDQFQLIGETTSAALEPPNALGFLLNLTNVTSLDNGLLKSHFEAVYTTPSLYLNEKYMDKEGNISHNRESDSTYYYWNQDLIVGYNTWWGDDLSYSGYIYGPDSFVLQIGTSYEKKNWSIGASFTYKIHGQRGIRWHEKQDQTVFYADSVWQLGLTGTLEHSFLSEIKSEWTPCNGVGLRFIFAHIDRINNRNNEGTYWQDTQFSIGIILHPLEWFM